MKVFKILGVAIVASSTAFAANAATTTAGPGGYLDGFASTITYDTEAARGSSNGRDNPLNALGPNDGAFFEIGFGSFADFTFGTAFDTSATIYEVTFGSAAAFPEMVDVFAGTGVGAAFSGTFIGSMTNSTAAGGGSISLVGFGGAFETLRLVDNSSPINGATAGGFDVDAVRVSPVPLPAAGFLLLGALGGGVALRRRK